MSFLGGIQQCRAGLAKGPVVGRGLRRARFGGGGGDDGGSNSDSSSTSTSSNCCGADCSGVWIKNVKFWASQYSRGL